MHLLAVKTAIRPGVTTKLYVASLITVITMTLVDYPAGRPGWYSPLFLAWSIWLVSLFCRWPIPESPCDDLCGPSCWGDR